MARPDYSWSFPQDHWVHSGYRTEWWYFTGHLSSQQHPERRFGYQFTIFRIGLRPEPSPLDSKWATNGLIMGHAAISDLSGKRHVFSEILYREVSFLGGFGAYPESLIAWSLAPGGTSAWWRLFWNGEAFDFEMKDQVRGIAFALSTLPDKPLVFQGPNGYSRKGNRPGAASQYYSFTRLQTQGTLSIDGTTFQVEGHSWMDKEFGSNQLAENQVGWDWFSLQLEDGREMMLYHLRDKSGASDFARGTLVSSQGEVFNLKPEDWSLQVTGNWTSPDTGAVYPSRWKVSVPRANLHLEIIPLLAQQENRSRMLSNLYYWEGAVTILDREGKKVGQGYVELTGYGTNSRPPV
ncbi:carotenoid 1,2-hydratase [Acidobacteria bacterium AH-259-D05]|nr:carotenoid 1,2-hydratase [Acidobacteria bacterium AH-259-D05]